MNNYRSTDISSVTRKCARSFQDLVQKLRLSDGEYDPQFPLTDAEEDLGRFNLWATNLGAHHTSSRSLDYRLQNAPDVRDHVLRLLRDLYQLLLDGKSKALTVLKIAD